MNSITNARMVGPLTDLVGSKPLSGQSFNREGGGGLMLLDSVKRVFLKFRKK